MFVKKVKLGVTKGEMQGPSVFQSKKTVKWLRNNHLTVFFD